MQRTLQITIMDRFQEKYLSNKRDLNRIYTHSKASAFPDIYGGIAKVFCYLKLKVFSSF